MRTFYSFENGRAAVLCEMQSCYPLYPDEKSGCSFLSGLGTRASISNQQAHQMGAI